MREQLLTVYGDIFVRVFETFSSEAAGCMSMWFLEHAHVYCQNNHIFSHCKSQCKT